MNDMTAFRSMLLRGVDGASLAAFRIAFGVLMLWEVVRYFAHNWIREYWIEPTFHFQYLGFDWVLPWNGVGMYVHFGLLGVTAVGIALGYYYRACSILFLVGFAFQFVLEQARYLNHFYAAVLFALLLVVVPANAVWSVDSWERSTSRKSRSIPLWALWLLRFQVSCVYIFAAIAKLNDGWVSGAAWGIMLQSRRGVPLVDLLSAWDVERFVLGWGGLLFDLLVVPGLLWSRTRGIAFSLAVLFHFLNSQLFHIGIFPWMMLAATTLFFHPAWPRELLTFVSGRPGRTLRSPHSNTPMRISAFTALAVYVVLQTAIPLRHYLYPGDVAWTEEGHRFSWRMMLRAKRGAATFRIVSSSDTVIVKPLEYLRPWQLEVMTTRPDMILQFAHFLVRDAEKQGKGHPRVYVDVQVALNGGRPHALIDPRVDLGSQPRNLWAASWITQPDNR